MTPCLNCPRFARTRGLCLSHAARLNRRVRAGQTSYAAEIVAGRCLPATGGKSRAVHMRLCFGRTA